ncbi:MAG TPA: hypothetical protein VMT00_17275, partial [Thermoanaerobaculia bacterium]|nr:hypothetical protein [Thermoanaerobaculia bacterium]
MPKRHLRIIAGSIVGLLILLELRAAPLRWYHTVETPPVYRWLSDAPISGAVVELPLDKSNQYEVLLRSTV